MRSRRARSLALALAIVLLPSPVWIGPPPASGVFYPVGFDLADVALACLIVLSLPAVAHGVARRRVDRVGWLALALGALLVLAFAWHPSLEGAITLFRLTAAGAIALAIVELRAPRERGLLRFAVALTALTQSALAAAQLAVGDVIVAYAHPPVIREGPFIRPAGTLENSIVLAGYALVLAATLAAPALAGARRWTAIFALAVAPVGFTFSRAALLASGLMAIPLAAALRTDRRRAAPVLLALAAGVGLPALLTLGGWVAHDENYPSEASANDRLGLITQTLPLLAAQPLFGIGPGNTVTELRERKARVPGSVDLTLPPHVVPYLIALEAGVPAGLVGAALLVALGLRALRIGPGAAIIFLALIPHLLLDQYAWTAALGPPILGLWAGGSLAPPDEAPG